MNSPKVSRDMDEMTEAELVPRKNDLELKIDALSWCEPSLSIKFLDTTTQRQIAFRSFGCEDKIEGLFKYLIAEYDGTTPIGICQISVPLKPEYGRGGRVIAYCGSRNNSDYFLETLRLDDYGQRCIQKYFQCFDSVNGPGNDAFVIDKRYQGQDYAQLLLLVTQMLLQKRGVDTIKFMEDKTIKDGSSYYSWAAAAGETALGNTTIATAVNPAQLQLLKRFVPQ